MYCSSPKRKFPPAKKAWKNFTTTLKSNLHRLKRSEPIRHTTSQFSTAISKVLGRRPHRKRRAITRHLSDLGKRSRREFKPVYVEELFNEPAAVKIVGPPTEGSKAAEKADMTVDSSSSAADVKQLVGVDLKAEMFIAKFREELRLQRHRSLGE